jgi:hypothetical protein
MAESKENWLHMSNIAQNSIRLKNPEIWKETETV